MKTTLVAAFAALSLAACTKVPSDGIATRALFARYDVVVTGGVAEARASFTVGESSLTFVELVRGDAVYCNGVPLYRDSSAVGEVHYSASLPAQSAGYVFQLSRPGETVNTRVSGASSLAITAPAEGAQVSIRDPLRIGWTTGPDYASNVQLDLDGACTDHLALTAADEGRDTISSSQLVLRGSASCPARLTLRRSVERSLSSPFAGGRTSAGEEASVDVTLVP